jgi:omega-hydroxy-beta-dihydromenaquinone-9 sulfotransferase
VLFPSTVNMWKALYRAHGMQKPTFQGLDEYVLNCFNRMYETFEKTRQLIPPGRFCEIRYEDLVADPAGQMESLYTQLGLNGFDRFLPRLQSYLADVAGYETNRYELSPEKREEVGRRWATVIERYQYEPDR